MAFASLLATCIAAFVLLVVQVAAATSSDDTFDYIIVGGGTAGSVVAAQLCRALPQAKILVLERAPPRTATEEYLTRHIGATITNESTRIIQGFFTPPEPGLNDRQTIALTGNTLGGSSSVNGAMLTYPSKGQIPKYGIKGLTDERGLKFIRKVVHALNAAPPKSEALRELLLELIEGGARSGFQNTDPLDGVSTDGIWEALIAADPTQKRSDAAYAYLEPALISGCRANLQLWQDATVHKVLLEEKDCGALSAPCARGVSVQVGDEMRSVHATREVILSAGPYFSPQLLQLSGIGPKKVLSAAGVRTIVDLPVGQSLHGRAAVNVTSVHQRELSKDALKYNITGADEVARFAVGKDSITAASLPFNGRVNDLGYMVGRLNSIEVPRSAIINTFCIQGPDTRSRGHVNIQLDDVRAPLDFKLNLLTTPGEVERMVACVRAVKRLHRGLRPIFKSEEREPFTDDIFEPGRFDDLVAAVRQVAIFAWHLVSGAPVGEVLTDTLQVKGVAGLRVVDASAIPTMPSNAGPASLVYVIAEHMAELIAADFTSDNPSSMGVEGTCSVGCEGTATEKDEL